ncbi:hypothetical protein Tco_1254559 [Tanacetum coccineum]
MRPFGYPVTILNTLDLLGKFDRKADEGLFVRYSVNRSGPEWLFHIDTLTKSMNYKPVITGNQSNGNACTKENIGTCQVGKKTVPDQEYIGLPLQPVAPPSPDYILGPENLQILPVPQDEDEREPMFIQAHDPDYVPEPIYPEYIPLEDDHEFPAEEQPLPPIDSPTTESPGYVTESDPEEDPEEYEDDESEDGPVDYPMDGGDDGYDGDDDDGDSSGDDARDEDEDEEDEEEEEEHLAPADSTVIPADEPVFPPEGTEPVIPPPSTDITIGARITIRPQTSISLPPEAEVERLLAMTTPHITTNLTKSPPLLAGAHLLDAGGEATGIRDFGYGIRILGRSAEAETVWMVVERPAIREAGLNEGLGQATHQELQTHRDHVYAHETYLQAHQTQLQLQSTLIQTQHQASGPDGRDSPKIRDMRREMSDSRLSCSTARAARIARQSGPEARVPDHQEASGDADSHIS